ncbi:MAG: coproporphyrinogen III oxidase [Flavobacteriales bacterium CG_4_10_14_0_2_um_filter_32_8]|nr:MAG: coproporphyrinogen III oxidase [Flavobacteriales bacterium CG_4_10_14_0_2_um_filter_32_8]
MSGIYIHIPFCKQSCSYCDFHFSTSLKNKTEMIAAIIKEIASRKNQINSVVNTIYFGGGTPSILAIDDLKLLIDAVYKNYNVAEKIEFTIECNPDDLTQNKLIEFKNAGANRLSIGVQSFNNEELLFFNRAHSANQAETSIKLSQDVGFDNITIDLIYGSPLLTNKSWLKNLNKVKEFNIPHLSAYSLTVEPKTALGYQIKTGQLPTLNDDNTINQFQLLVKEIKKMGLTQYEVSNFAKEGYFSQHNSNYWKGEEYLGFGPSAHSYIKFPLERGQRGALKRCWNVANNIKYINALTEGSSCFEEEIIDEITAYNEYILTRLRTIWGIDIDYIKTNFNEKINRHFKQELTLYLNSSYLHQLNTKVVLTDEGILMTDKITSDLFYVK